MIDARTNLSNISKGVLIYGSCTTGKSFLYDALHQKGIRAWDTDGLLTTDWNKVENCIQNGVQDLMEESVRFFLNHETVVLTNHPPLFFFGIKPDFAFLVDLPEAEKRLKDRGPFSPFMTIDESIALLRKWYSDTKTLTKQIGIDPIILKGNEYISDFFNFG